MQSMVRAMNTIKSASGEISKILKTIDEISFKRTFWHERRREAGPGGPTQAPASQS